MLTAGSWDLLRWGRQSDFYDVQARSLLNGTFAMDQRVLGIESFARGDQHFMYFGPVPALLRLPFITFARQLDGRLAAISMLLALGVTLVALLSLGWRLRRRVVTADDRLISRFESVSVALTFFAMIGGSSLLYASSRTWVYHEAILWGVALTLASLAFLLAWLDHRSSWLLVGASAFAMLAILTRPSVGGGALAAMGLVAGRELLAMLPGDRRRDAGVDGRDGESDGSDDPHARHWVHGTLTVAVVVVPVLVYSLVNWLKFRRLLGVPFDQQGYTLLSQQRRDMLDANGGDTLQPKFCADQSGHLPPARSCRTRWHVPVHSAATSGWHHRVAVLRPDRPHVRRADHDASAARTRSGRLLGGRPQRQQSTPGGFWTRRTSVSLRAGALSS